MPARKSMAAPIQSKSENDYRAEGDHRTLIEAEAVKADPDRMKRVGVVHKKMAQDLSRVGAKLGVKTPKKDTDERPAKMPMPKRMKIKGIKRPSLRRSR